MFVFYKVKFTEAQHFKPWGHVLEGLFDRWLQGSRINKSARKMAPHIKIMLISMLQKMSFWYQTFFFFSNTLQHICFVKEWTIPILEVSQGMTHKWVELSSSEPNPLFNSYFTYFLPTKFIYWVVSLANIYWSWRYRV